MLKEWNNCAERLWTYGAERKLKFQMLIQIPIIMFDFDLIT